MGIIETGRNKLILIDRAEFTLGLYKRPTVGTSAWKLVKEYIIAVGLKGYETPEGVYTVRFKAKCPDWLVPDSEWATSAGLIPGTIIQGCTPENPLKKRWIGVTDPKEGIGIHGTAAIESLGGRASHGCIRMAPGDVIELYDKVPKGTTIVIS